MTKINPCEQCGNEHLDTFDFEVFEVWCVVCNNSTTSELNMDDAIELWNLNNTIWNRS